MRIVFFAMISLLICAGIACSDNVVRIATGEFPPYCSENLKYNGLILRIITESFKETGMKVEFKFMPWARAIKSWQDPEKFHGTAYWLPQEERKKVYHYSAPMLNEHYNFFFLKVKPLKTWNKFEDLKGLNIGLTRGYAYDKRLIELGEQGVLNLDVCDSDYLNLKKLLYGRIDIFPIPPEVAYYILSIKFDHSVVPLLDFNPKPLTEGTQHLLLNKQNKKNKEIMEAFNKGLKKLKDSGRIDIFKDGVLSGEYNIKK